VLCRFGQQQFMALLPNTTTMQGQRILQRLAAGLKDRELLLKSRLQPLTPPDKS
jgi:GGDEF domain-containing protein